MSQSRKLNSSKNTNPIVQEVIIHRTGQPQRLPKIQRSEGPSVTETESWQKYHENKHGYTSLG